MSGNGEATVVTITENNQNLCYIIDDDGSKLPVDAINNLVKSGFVISSPSFSFDARTLFFAAKSTVKRDFDIYVSNFIGGEWSNPKPFNPIVNSSLDEVSPSLSADANRLYFARIKPADPNVRRSTESAYIYSSAKDENGRFQLPSIILISTGADYAVSALPDNETILFSSLRNYLDKKQDSPILYDSKRVLNTNWLDPTPILSPIPDNNPSFPSYSVLSKSVNYIHRNKKSDASELRSIAAPTINFILPIHVVGGSVRNIDDNKNIGASVNVIDMRTANILFTQQVADDGMFSIALPAGHDYLLDFHAPNMSHVYHRFLNSELAENKKSVLDIALSNRLNLSFSLFDKLILQPISAELKVTDFNNYPYNDIKISSANNEKFNLILPLGREYRLHFNSNAYEPYEINLSSNREIQFNKTQLDVELQPLMKPISFKVVDAVTNENIVAQIELKNNLLSEVVELTSNSSGILDTLLRQSTKYSINTVAKEYIYDVKLLDMAVFNDEAFVIALQPIAKGATVQLSDVNFEYNSAQLTPASLSALELVLQLLVANPDVNIELAAHTDDKGNDLYNLKLSQQRAQSVLNYLVSKGIDAQRLQAKGYGESKPIVPNDSDENCAKNRRVEFIIL